VPFDIFLSIEQKTSHQALFEQYRANDNCFVNFLFYGLNENKNEKRNRNKQFLIPLEQNYINVLLSYFVHFGVLIFFFLISI